MKTLPAAAALFALAYGSTSRVEERYVAREVRGWNVQVERGLERGANGKAVLELLDHKLFDIERAVPSAALTKLRAVTVWLSESNAVTPCMCYHPSAVWLKEHGFDERKARGVEIANAATFLDWSKQQPAMVLHELAHAYHHQVLGYDDASVRAAFEHATASGAYDDVLYCDGSRKKAYALNNDTEFFAELSEAWFGTNDFFPFVQAEVLASDPTSAAMLRKAWGE